MANPGGQSEIGSVSVGIKADNSQLKQGLKESETQVKQFAATTEGETTKATMSFARLGRSVRGLITPFTAVIGTVALLTATISRLAGIFQSGESKAKAFALTLGNDVNENLNRVSKVLWIRLRTHQLHHPRQPS
jgi:phage-related minor tail protein